MLSQIDLIGAILKHLEKKKQVPNTRQMNAVIEAATTIVKEFDREHQPAKPDMGLAKWLQCDDTGLSSLYMASVLAGCAGEKGPVAKLNYPHDPADFGRCVGLLRAEPLLRPHLHYLMKPEHGPQWAVLVGAWVELERLYVEEFPSGTAPKLFALMNTLTGDLLR